MKTLPPIVHHLSLHVWYGNEVMLVLQEFLKGFLSFCIVVYY